MTHCLDMKATLGTSMAWVWGLMLGEVGFNQLVCVSVNTRYFLRSFGGEMGVLET